MYHLRWKTVKRLLKKCKIRFHIKLNKYFWKKVKKRTWKMVFEIGSVYETSLNGKLPLKRELKTMLSSALD